MAGLGDLLGGLGGSIGGLIGWGDTSGDRDQINNIIQGLQGQAQGLGTSAFQGLSTDPATRNAQMQALSQLSNIASSGGNDPASQAAMAQARSNAAQFEQGQRGAILNDMQARGMGGSGAEMASLMGAQQAGANRDAQGSLDAAAASRARAMAALGQMGSLAGNIRNEDWDQAAQKASAEDAAKRAAFGGAMQAGGLGIQNDRQNMATQMGLDQGLGEGIGGAVGGIASLGMGGGLSAPAGLFGGGGGGGSAPSASGGYGLGQNNPNDPFGIGSLSLGQ